MFRDCVERFSARSNSWNHERQRVGFVVQFKMFDIAEIIAVNLMWNRPVSVDLNFRDIGVKRNVFAVSKVSA